jgi:hypothetical protein
VEEKICFVIMPFSSTTHTRENVEEVISEEQWSFIFEKWIKRAVETYPKIKYSCKRSPAAPGNFIKGIVQDIAESDLVIADLTGGKPNVYYELGIRHSLKLGTVIITQSLQSLPSDLYGYYAFEYKFSDSASQYEKLYKEFEKELHDKIESFGKSKIASDSPVSDFLGFRAYLIDKKGYEDKENLKWMVASCHKAMRENYSTCKVLYNALNNEEEIELTAWPVIDTYPLETLYSYIHTYQWKVFPSDIGGQIAEHIREHRKLMLSIEQHWQVFRINPNNDAASYLAYMLKYICEEREPMMSELWEQIEKSLDSIGISATYKDDDGVEHVLASRQFEKPNF